MKTQTKNVIFRLFTALLLSSIFAPLIIFVIELARANKEGEYLINIVGLVGVGVFLLIELVMVLINLVKPIIFHALIFNEHNSTINWPAFIVANIGLVIGLVMSIIGIVLYFTNADLTIKTSAMVIVPIGLFLLANTIAYNVYVVMFKARKVGLKELIEK